MPLQISADGMIMCELLFSPKATLRLLWAENGGSLADETMTLPSELPSHMSLSLSPQTQLTVACYRFGVAVCVTFCFKSTTPFWCSIESKKKTVWSQQCLLSLNSRSTCIWAITRNPRRSQGRLELVRPFPLQPRRLEEVCSQ